MGDRGIESCASWRVLKGHQQLENARRSYLRRLCLTRLETRTKESTACASVRVGKTQARSEGERRQGRVIAPSQHLHRVEILSLNLRPSALDGTRKMVNYACAG